MEISRSSLPVDLQVKARIDAAAGVPDYWVLDVVGRALNAHSQPGPDGYRRITRETGRVVNSGSPSLTLDVVAVLPTP